MEMIKVVNHRICTTNTAVYSRLFQADEWDSNLLYPHLELGVKSMEEKLSNYTANQLPGGKYWEPDGVVKTVLKDLKPNNDLCESILGLNDYLATAIPNMHKIQWLK